MSKRTPTARPAQPAEGWDYHTQRLPVAAPDGPQFFTPPSTAHGWRNTPPEERAAVREWLVHLDAGRMGGKGDR